MRTQHIKEMGINDMPDKYNLTEVADIFADIAALVALVPSERDKESLSASLLEMQREYESAYGLGELMRDQYEERWLADIRNPEKIPSLFPDGHKPYQRAYKTIHDFVETITPKLESRDTDAVAWATYLATFCNDMCAMLQSFGAPGRTYPQRIKDQLQLYSPKRHVGLVLGVEDPPAVAEARQLISHRHNAASTWTLCEGKPFMRRVHDSFNSIGQMFMFTFCGSASKERQTEFRNFLTGLFDCQERFYVWYDGAKNMSYAPGVAAFLALRAILDQTVFCPGVK